LAGTSAPSQQWRKPLNRATRAVASTLGVLVGLAGVEHGFFELLQGNVTPSGMMIDAIGPTQRFWEHGTERALTIVPSFLLTGVLALVFGLSVIIWAGAFVDRRYGAGTLMLLSIILWSVGGGFAPIFIAAFAGVTATRINRPLNWWRAHLPPPTGSFLARLWPWFIILFVIVYAVGVEIAVFGYPLLWFYSADITFSIQNALAYVMLVLCPFSILTALSHDIQGRIS
jgi:hypothetical protein